MVRQMRQRKHREAQGVVLLEGQLICEEAARAGAGFKLVLCSESGLRASEALVRGLQDSGVECHLIEDAAMERVSATASPQGILALVETPRAELPSPPFGRDTAFLWLDRVADPGNVGTLVRSADAAGASGVVSAGGADPWGPKAVRSSMGSIFHLPVVQADEDEASDAVADLRAAGCRVVCAGPRGGSWPWSTDLRGPIVLVLGNEARGVAADLLAISDATVSIPNFGRAESLNVAQAGAVLLFELARQIRA
jgi:TrmH family RNA methyltransferase